jgi:hypothetical protein
MPIEDVRLGINLFGRQPLSIVRVREEDLKNDGMLVIKCALRKQVMSMWTGTEHLSVVFFG